MKKLTAILLLISMITVLSGCANNDSVEQVGAFETDYYSISVPNGWIRTVAENNIVFMTKDYPEHPSYIMIGTSSDNQVDELIKNKDIVIEQVKKQMVEKVGETANADVPVYEEIEVNGARCVHTILTYTADGNNVLQDQYSFDTSAGGATFTYASIGSDDFKAEFEKSIASIEIR